MTPTVQSWLDARAAGVPPALMEQIRAAAIASFGDGAVTGGAEGVAGQRETKEELDRRVQEFIGVVAEQLKQLKNRDCAERQDALDLLTVDALLTYVLELVASVRPDALDRYAIELMRLVGGA